MSLENFKGELTWSNNYVRFGQIQRTVRTLFLRFPSPSSVAFEKQTLHSFRETGNNSIEHFHYVNSY